MVAMLALALPCISGCGDHGQGAQAATHDVSLSEKDFRISAPPVIPSGRVDLAVHNLGPIAHELIVIRARTKNLPLRADGITVNEEKLADETAGALEPQPEGIHDLDVSLSPGHYVFLCNMTGHYRAGMQTEVRVR